MSDPGQSAAIYAISGGAHAQTYVRRAVQRLSASHDRVLVVAPEALAAEAAEALGGFSGVSVTPHSGTSAMLSLYRVGLGALGGDLGSLDHVTLTGDHVFGPFRSADTALKEMRAAEADYYCAYFHDCAVDARLAREDKAPRFDYVVFDRQVLASDAFARFWAAFRSSGNFWTDFQTGSLTLFDALSAEGLRPTYSVNPANYGTAEPAVHEIHLMMAEDAIVAPVGAFLLDPLVTDVAAVELRQALDILRRKRPNDYKAIIEFIVPRQQLRHVATNFDDYRILPTTASDPAKKRWEFGRYAVFIHAFYVDMMPDFWRLIQRLPGEFDLFLTTSTDAHREAIEHFLGDRRFPARRMEVRVVDQNRGRDMSSLFISFRDVILSNKYKVALRLHSKRTPQVSRRVSESFKSHLFDNLIHSKGYVANLLDMMEANPDVGLVIPPTIHIGFGTMGHSWFANREPFMSLAHDMGLNVPFDDNTPVAPYGTMYWFRTDALRLMFEWKWRWEDYNPEPNHIDGGLAHVQERLIGYCAQQKGYRVVSVMTPTQAERNYAKLEYKMQLLASRLSHGGAVFDRHALTPGRSGVLDRLHLRVAPAYVAFVQRAPWARRPLKPFVRFYERRVLGKTS